MLERDPRSTAEKIDLFRAAFPGLDHVYGTYDIASGRSWQVKQPVTKEVIVNHIMGRKPLGRYLLTGTHTRAVVVDYDDDVPDLPIEFLNQATHYEVPSYIEVSKAKGFHVWIFFQNDGVPAVKARAVVKHILDEVEHNAEVFPKQDAIDLSRGEYGNFVNLPLYARHVLEGRTVFLDPANGLRPVPNQWKLLETFQRVGESLLDEIIEINEIEMDCPRESTGNPVLGTVEQGLGLPPCARRMLAEGVTHDQRVACFRLAIHLRRQGVPFDIAVAALHEWSKKNRPSGGKRIITTTEIKSQATDAFAKNYRGCACDEPAIAPFCEPTCPIATKTAPVSAASNCQDG